MNSFTITVTLSVFSLILIVSDLFFECISLFFYLLKECFSFFFVYLFVRIFSIRII